MSPRRAKSAPKAEPEGGGANPYDEVPYPNYAYPLSHPDRLATVAKLFGLRAPDVAGCRVLELGCARGGNLIPMAEALPEARFVGVERSARQVGEARAGIRALGLENIEIQEKDILDVGEDMGSFDYVICHGVYSWVPAEVREKILSACAENLAPEGVAYVSYNVYPGWNMRGMVRDMMLYHTSRFPKPETRAQEARSLLEFLSKSAPAKSPYAAFLQSEFEKMRRHADAYLLHDHLEVDNAPLWFHEFIERARGAGLAYLGEADVGSMSASGLGAEAAKSLQKVARNVVELEQYMDFLRFRAFRQTLLCHEGTEVQHGIGPESLEGMHVAGGLELSEQEGELADAAPWRFRHPSGKGLASSDPVVKSALVELEAAWPESITFEDLLAKARGRLGREGGADDSERKALGETLLHSFVGGLVELTTRPSPITAEVAPSPKAGRFAWHQAASSTTVTNLKHQLVRLGKLDRLLLRHADGSRDHEALVDLLVELASRGQLGLEQNGERVEDEASRRRLLTEAVSQGLRRLARNALLLSETPASGARGRRPRKPPKGTARRKVGPRVRR